MSEEQYTELNYVWQLFEGDEQIATGGFRTNARIEYESQTAMETGEAPVNVYHLSAYMKSRKQAEVQLRALEKYPSGGGNWGKWRAEKNGVARSVPLLVDEKEAFRLHLAAK